MRRVLAAAEPAAAAAQAGTNGKLLDDVEDLGRELNFGSLDIMVGMTGESQRRG